jgi:APA family basic amino acid/polyamine antiporter
MFWKQLWATKSLETLHKEMQGENRLRRVLGPIGLTSLGIGAIIGAGIFVTTGEAAATRAGPAVMLSFVVAGLGCALAALCYAEFAAMAPVAGSAYTYAYATLGELLAWIIGWDLVLEYAMSCATLAADWTKYFNQLLDICFDWHIPDQLSNDPFTLERMTGSFVGVNLPAILLMALCTVVLVIGIRESVTTNAILVGVKLGVVLFVIGVGVWYINGANWTRIPPDERKITDTGELLRRKPEVAQLVPESQRHPVPDGATLLKDHPQIAEVVSPDLLKEIKGMKGEVGKWGLISVFGLNHWLEPLDDRYRSPFLPYGLSGIMVGAALVFFAYIGFDAISTHSEEARRPQRDVPFGILTSLAVCTVLYLAVSAVLTGIQPYPEIDPDAGVAVAFKELAKQESSPALKVSAGLIAAGALAGITSVILITFLSQARIFLAIARDGLLPTSIFGAVHPRFRTPHLSTILVGVLLCVVTALTPIQVLFEMVNIGTLLAFTIVCAAVLILRLRRPDAPRPFRCPALYLLAPVGIVVNLLMMLFLPIDTWLRLVGWLVLGMLIFIGYGFRHSALGQREWRRANGLALESDGDVYYQSESYRRRLTFSLWFCVIAAVAASGAIVWLLWRWFAGTLGAALPDINPVIVMVVAGGLEAFLLLMVAVNLREWHRLRASTWHAPG